MLRTNIICGALLVVCCYASVDSARILGVFPMPFLSHQIVFRAFTKELAKRGHELVVITPNPALPKNRPPDNITEIDISSSYGHKFKVIDTMKNKFKRGVSLGGEQFYSQYALTSLIDIVAKQLDHPDVKRIINDEKQNFDLIIVEAHYKILLYLSVIFKAPTIVLSSFYGFPSSYETVGAISRHPIYYPHLFRHKFGSLSFFEKLWETKVEYNFMNVDAELDIYNNKLLKEKFGINTPTVEELTKNIDFLLINVSPIFCDNRPVPPNVAYVGPLHLQPAKELPQDLQTYLDNSATGVIYVSLGTNVLTSKMDADLLDAFVKAFEILPYDFLWKCDSNLKIMPKNLKIQEWFPQRDILVHHNIKLFVTQGGMQSTDEAIDATVPMVVIPLSTDQFYNAHKFEQLGIGVKLDVLTLDATTLVEGIKTVLSNDSYRANIRKMKLLLHDHMLTPMEKAVWWTEYVIRHNGTPHLRCPTTHVSWAEYLMLDVVIALFSIVIIMLILILLTLKYVMKVITRRMRSRKAKLP